MDNLLQCTICYEKYNSNERLPLILKCGHTFCIKCLETIVKNKEKMNNVNKYDDSVLKCPIDKLIGFETTNIKDIPINRLILDIIQLKNDNYISASTNKDENDIINYQFEKEVIDYEVFIQKEKKDISSRLNGYYDGLISLLLEDKQKFVHMLDQWFQTELINISKWTELTKPNLQINLNQKKDIIKTIKIIREEDYIPVIQIDHSINERVKQLLSSFSLIIPELPIDKSNKDSNENEKKDTCLSQQNHHSNQELNNLITTYLESKESQMIQEAQFIWFKPNSNLIYEFCFSSQEWILSPNYSHYSINEMSRTCSIAKNQIFITGGVKDFKSSKDVYLYSDGIFTKKCSMLEERRAHSIIKVNLSVLVFGGIDSQNKHMNQCEEYNIISGKWTYIKSMPVNKSHMGICSYNSTNIYIIGGETSDEHLSNTIEKYDSTLKIWETIRTKLPNQIECSICGYMTSLQAILIIGGYSNTNGKLNSIYIMNLKDHSIIEHNHSLKQSGWSVYQPIFNFQINKQEIHSIDIFLGGEDNPPMHLNLNCEIFH